MTDPNDELEARVEALETRVDGLSEQVQHTRSDAAAARVLAGGADRDVETVRGELRDFRRATAASFTAMRADFTAMRTDFTDLRTEMRDGFAKVDDGFTEIRGRLDATAASLSHITDLLTDMTGHGGG